MKAQIEDAKVSPVFRMTNKKIGVFSYFSGNRPVKFTLGLLIIFVVADGLITNLLISHNLAWELNPFLTTMAGTNLLVWVKICGAVVCAFLLWDIHKRWPRVAAVGAYGFTLIYAVIVLWNVFLWVYSGV